MYCPLSKSPSLCPQRCSQLCTHLPSGTCPALKVFLLKFPSMDPQLECHGFHCFLVVFHCFRHCFCVGFFKELDFKELEIHRYSLMDIHQWIHWWTSINDIHWWTIDEFIDGPSMNMVPFFWALSFGPHGAAFGPRHVPYVAPIRNHSPQLLLIGAALRSYPC